MPWTPDDAERHTHKATTQELKELWAKVANDCLERTGDEGRAIREANAVVRRQAEDRYSQASPHSGHSHRSYRLTEARAEFTTEVRRGVSEHEPIRLARHQALLWRATLRARR